MSVCKMFQLAAAALVAVSSLSHAQQSADAPLYNVATRDFGATAKSSGSPFNKDWPASSVLDPPGRGGALFGTSETLVGGRIDIRPIISVDLEAIAVSQLDWGNVRSPKTIDIYINGKKVKTQEIPLQPGKFFQFPLQAKNVEEVGIAVTEEYPKKELKDGKTGPGYGGWSRMQLLSKTDFSKLMAAPAGYAPVIDSQSLAASDKAIVGEVKVYGEPRVAVGHPNTIWDKEDIAHFKAMLKTSPELKKQFDALKKGLDERITKPLGIPTAVKGADGNYIHVSDSFEGRGGIHNNLAVDIANLGTLYALTDDAKYGEFAKKLLLAYAAEFPNYAPGNRPGFAHDAAKVFDQRLGDAIWVIQLARGYDLIYNLPSITPEERARIQDDLLIACADYIRANGSVMRAPTNWSAICTAAVLIIGYATDTERLVNDARWGLKGTPEKPTGGIHLHFSEKTIDIDGMWSEGAMGYQFMALQALITDAEILWRNGVDMYRYRNGALKSLFDSPLEFSYPNLRTPAIHDSGSASIIGRDSYLYEFAYLRYRDPKYLTILNQLPTHLATQYQQWPVSILYDRDTTEAAQAVEWDSVNLNGVGYGILRNTTDKGTISLLIDYGPNRSHGHPDKLNIDLWAHGDRLIPDPGTAWYETQIYKTWYSRTLAHNTIIVDQKDQLACDATQLVYGPAQTIGIQRASTAAAYPGVTMDRSLFLTENYVADIYGAFAQLPRQLELAWHIRGDFSTKLPLADYAFPPDSPDPYKVLENTKTADGSKPWTAEFNTDGRKYRFIADGQKGTQLFFGDGVLNAEKPITIIQRRTAADTIYANAIDLSLDAEPYVKSLVAHGSLAAGFAALEIKTADGADTAFASYRPGAYAIADIKTDAAQAFVRRNGTTLTAAYIGGGTTLEANGLNLAREGAGLLYLELAENGSYLLANPSPTSTIARVSYQPLNGLSAYKLALDGKRISAELPLMQTRAFPGTYIIPLAIGERIEFAKKGAPSIYDYRAKILADRAAADAAAAQKIVDEINARDAQRIKASAEKPLPKNTIIAIQAETYTAEGGGKIKTLNDRIGAIGEVLQGWNDVGHWLEWEVEAPSEGYYNFAICYAQ